MSFSRKSPWPNQKFVAPQSGFACFTLAYVKKVSSVLLLFYLLPINLFAWTNGELLIWMDPGRGRALDHRNNAEQRFEHYRLVTGEDGKPVELGRGAMGVTYKAFDVDLRCPVALKVISEKYLGYESARLRFLHEARAAASLRHSNVAY